MGKIFVMPDALASQVAAGEVVERPAAVLKELLENSLDSGATRIEAHMDRGGKGLIRVIDDGTGMDRQDALLALERHATSKIRHKDDLANICTMGFRGEALPSIASVCRFVLRSREADSLVGTEIFIDGGQLRDVRDWGGAPGTDIEARSLFHNMPGRRKFLRTNETESAHCETVLRIQALAHPEIGFSLTKDGRPLYHFPSGEGQRERIGGFLGRSMADRLLPVQAEESGLRLSGLIAPPGLSRSDRSLQLLFVNKRPVESQSIHFGLREGYRNALMKGEYPIVFLFLEMHPSEFDINVHPAKKEIKFRDGNRVRDFLARSVVYALNQARHNPAGVILPGRRLEDGQHTLTTPDLIPTRDTHVLRRDWQEPGWESTDAHNETPSPSAPPPSASLLTPPNSEKVDPTSVSEPLTLSGREKAQQNSDVSQWRFLGVLNRLYVLLETPEGLVVMDQHAAHERVLFEQMKTALERQAVPAQKLLIPLTWELPGLEYEFLMRHRELLGKFGVGLESFGPRAVKIDSIPILAKEMDADSFLKSVLTELRGVTSISSAVRLGEDVIASTVCRHAVKAHDVLSEQELNTLLHDLFACEMPYCCPHGRPTVIQISSLELEKKFGRRS